MVLLECKNINKSFNIGLFKKKQVIQGIDFIVNKGEFICITGKSGEGKTTFIKILAGIIRPDAGQIFYSGKKIGLFTNFFRKHISFIFQDYKLIPHLNVFENVSLPLRIRNIPDWKKKSLDNMEYVGISHLAKQYPYQISGGESQRTSIARALSIEPEIIFADEPTGNLDQETEKEILNVFQSIKTNLKKTFIIVTHEPNILLLADKSYKIAGGKIHETK